MQMDALLSEIAGCTVCAARLPLGPRPIVRASPRSRILLISQAPGRVAHLSGIPWDDDSGGRLKAWLAVDDATFYDPDSFAILPMGLCYPGRRSGGDAPPCRECAPLWHPRILGAIGGEPLRILIGAHAQKRYLGGARQRTMTETVRRFADHLPAALPLPHPSWRVRGWMRRNPWFEADVLPRLRAEVRRALGGQSTRSSSR